MTTSPLQGKRPGSVFTELKASAGSVASSKLHASETHLASPSRQIELPGVIAFQSLENQSEPRLADGAPPDRSGPDQRGLASDKGQVTRLAVVKRLRVSP